MAWCQWWNCGVARSQLQRAEVEPHVGVDEHRVERDEDEVGRHRHRSKPSMNSGMNDEAARDDLLDDVQPRPGQPVHCVGRVVHGVEVPQPRHAWNARCTQYCTMSVESMISRNCTTHGSD